MPPFTRVSGTAAPLPEDNIDTDIIFPARFLLITARDGLGAYAFHDWRFDREGTEIPDFILNRVAWRGAQILVTGSNFGCGSSREQAVWALFDAGIRCVIAPSFGEIFESNCVRNGLLPIRLDAEQLVPVMNAASRGERLSVDLELCKIGISAVMEQPFSVRAEWRQALLNGWDETAMILNQWDEAIRHFEAAQRRAQPWLYAHPHEQGATA